MNDLTDLGPTYILGQSLHDNLYTPVDSRLLLVLEGETFSCCSILLEVLQARMMFCFYSSFLRVKCKLVPNSMGTNLCFGASRDFLFFCLFMILSKMLLE
jgi:hypothetical protein